ncbi:ArsR/SmtB family transcription factor [Thaumasiovibrio sp. DFM-14]|uniref:ArsR/SmtB family transcription factor n=1 Tax=Thaumasiovibrio sp. DFM-14 TaxID=3384792 RepID=UPI0039A12B9B
MNIDPIDIDSMNIDAMRSNSTQAAEFLKSMAHPERLMVLCQLIENERGFTELWQASQLSQSAFSQQLKVLRQHQLVSVRKESQQVFYSLSDERIKLLLNTLHRVFCDMPPSSL